MYIIDPFYIYLIEQLSSINGILFLLAFASLIGTVVSLIIENENTVKKEKILRDTIDYHLRSLNSHLDSIKENTESISNSLKSIQSDSGLDEFSKSNILAKASNLSMYMPALKNTNKMVNNVVEDYKNSSIFRFPSPKVFLRVLFICIVLLAFVPTKESAYRILFSSMLTVENVTKAGNVTSEVANDIVDKITESIIKIQEAKK